MMRKLKSEEHAPGGADWIDPIGSNETSTSSVASAARFDVCPTWLDLAIRHLSDAGAAQVSRVAEYRGADGAVIVGGRLAARP